jgi:hypothetical protein
MKKLFAAVILLFTLLVLSTSAEALNCTIRSGSCAGGEVCLFSMNKLNNSHAGTCAAYENKVCCDSLTAVNIRSACLSDESSVISLYATANAHAGGFNNHVCVQPRTSCMIRNACKSFETALVSIYAPTNAHVAEKNFYGYKLCCVIGGVYKVTGTVFNPMTGEPLREGRVMAILKETGEVDLINISDTGNFTAEFPMSVDANQNKFTLAIFANSTEGEIGYSQVLLGSGGTVQQRQTCSVKTWRFRGKAFAESGELIPSGRVTITVSGLSNSTTFSNGVWDIAISPCLISGEVYTFSIIVSNGFESRLQIKQVAK